MGLEEELVPAVYFQLGPLQVTSTVVNTWIIMAAVCAILIVMGRQMRVKPTRWQNALEWIVEAVDGLIRNLHAKNESLEQSGERSKK